MPVPTQNENSSKQPEFVNSSLLVRMVDITKQFPGVLANDKVNFDLKSGEVHALLGENGAGKSTLMNILYGLYHPDSGQIFVNGQEVSISSSAEAIKYGIGMVHQSFRHVRNLTVVENVILGLPSKRPLLDFDAASKRVKNLAERYKLEVDPDALMWQLSAGQQQSVEILKALYRNIKVLILDEPTSVLTPFETEGLFEVMANMAEEGFGVVFISHKLDEVLQTSHRISVLRDGRHIKTLETPSTDAEDLEESRSRLAIIMVGREVVFDISKEDVQPGQTILQVDGLSVDNDAGRAAVQDLSFELRQGEILGIAGVAGNGQGELAEVLAGLRSSNAGKIILQGEEITGFTPRQITQSGVAFIPDKPREMAILPSFSIKENSALKVHADSEFRNGPFVNEAAISARADALIKAFDVRTPSSQITAEKLSGGNLHKLVLACELSLDPKLIIASNPTAGLDVGATEYIRRRLLAEREQGKGVVLISSDLEEILVLSDRIAVMFEGKIVGVVTPEQATPKTMGLLMAGVEVDLDRAVEFDNSNPETVAWASPEALEYEKEAGLDLKKIFSQDRILKLLKDRNALTNLGAMIVAIVLAFIFVGLLLFAFMGVNPINAFLVLVHSALGTKNGFAEILVRATPLTLAGLGIVIAFRSGVWNIGAEGQIYIGGLGAALVGLIAAPLPAIIHIPLTILAGFLFGAAYGAIPGILRVTRGANEIITTIMFNYIAILFVGYLVSWPMRDPNLLLPMPQSAMLADSARFQRIISGTRAHAGVFLALLAVIVIWFVLWKFVLGYQFRVVGENPIAAKFGGINVSRKIILAIAISGGLAGLAGVVEVAGTRGFLNETFSPGYGYTAIAVALLGGLHPTGVVAASLFFGFLIAGAEGMQRTLGVPSATIFIIEGLVLVFVIARRLLVRNR